MGSPDVGEQGVVTLRDGRVVTLTVPNDVDRADVARLLEALHDPRGTFFARVGEQGAADPPHGALVARTSAGELAGYAAWIADGGERGEFAGAVDPRFSALGLGTLLLRRGAGDALSAGLRALRVELHAGSEATAAMLRDSGLRTHWDLDHPVVHVEILLGTERPGWVTP
jgi:GNAT superfamily N-acetyltransferase